MKYTGTDAPQGGLWCQIILRGSLGLSKNLEGASFFMFFLIFKAKFFWTLPPPPDPPTPYVHLLNTVKHGLNKHDNKKLSHNKHGYNNQGYNKLLVQKTHFSIFFSCKFMLTA